MFFTLTTTVLKAMAGTAIGIDLGTTFSCVAAFRNGIVDVLTNEKGERTTPSVVRFNDTGHLVGTSAKIMATENAKNVIFDSKRLIGRRLSDPGVADDVSNWPFNVVPQNSNYPLYAVEHCGNLELYSPVEISSMVIRKLMRIAENGLCSEIRQAVVTVPAYFNDSQRKSTLAACKVAGLEVLRLLNEPTAAAIAYSLNHAPQGETKCILVYDLGGGTFDVTLLEVKGKVVEVKATSGDTHLGGADFDRLLVDYCVNDFMNKTRGANPTSDPKAMWRLRSACERAKHHLSADLSACISIDPFFNKMDYTTNISRACFEDLCEDLIQRTLTSVQLVLSDANVSKDSVDEVVLVGGSSRIPRVQEILSDFFGGKVLNKRVNPDEVVAHGAAFLAFVLSGGASSLTDGFQLIDVVPMTLMIGTEDGKVSRHIMRNTPVPASTQLIYGTASDNQTSGLVQLFEGEGDLQSENVSLGMFTLTGIPRAPRGTVQLFVMVAVDRNGLITVKATIERTGSSNSMTITADEGSRYNMSEIAAMVVKARPLIIAERDTQAKVTAINSLERVALRVKRQISEPGALQLSWIDKQGISTAADDALKWLKSNLQATTHQLSAREASLRDMCSAIGLQL